MDSGKKGLVNNLVTMYCFNGIPWMRLLKVQWVPIKHSKASATKIISYSVSATGLFWERMDKTSKIA